MIIIFMSIRSPKTKIEKQHPVMGDYNFENVVISLLKDGKKEWVLSSKKSSYYNDSQTIYFESLDGTYFFNQKTGSVKFNSPNGTFNFDSGYLKMIKSTSHLNSNDSNYFIRADELELSTEDAMLYAYGNLNITSDSLNLTAQKMIGNFKENKIYLSYDIDGTIINPSN